MIIELTTKLWIFETDRCFKTDY